MNDTINLNDTLEEKTNLKIQVDKFDDFVRRKTHNKEEDKTLTTESANKLRVRRQKVFNVFESKIISIRIRIY